MNLVEQGKARGYSSELITLQVGSRGVPDLPGFENLATSLSLPHKDLVRIQLHWPWLGPSAFGAQGTNYSNISVYVCVCMYMSFCVCHSTVFVVQCDCAVVLYITLAI